MLHQAYAEVHPIMYLFRTCRPSDYTRTIWLLPKSMDVRIGDTPIDGQAWEIAVGPRSWSRQPHLDHT